MYFKNLVSIALISTVLLTGSFAYASDNISLTMENPVVVEEKMPTALSYSGSVDEILTEDTKLSAIIIKEDGLNSDRRFNISEKTVVIDNESAVAQSITSIKKGDKISVYASPISTFSLPPQSAAYVILANIQKKAPAKLIKVQEIANSENGSLKITDTDNQYVVGVTKDTVLLPYRTRQIVTMDSIEKGDYILVWSEIMTMSIPAQMTADSVVLLKGFDFDNSANDQEYTGSEVPQGDKIIISTQAGVISVNGKEISLNVPKETFYKNGVYMLPVRAVSEELGYKVLWNNKDKRVDIVKGAKTFTLNIGNKECGKQKMIQLLKTAPEIKKGLTYVPIEFFSEIMEIEVAINNSNV